MATEFLQGMQLGSTMAARAQDMRANALNMSQRLMQMQQQQEVFPLELQQLQNKQTLDSMNIQTTAAAINAQHADDVAWTLWHKDHTNAIDILTNPPVAGTLDGMKRVATAQKVVGDTIAGMELIATQQAKNPLIKAQIDRYNAARAASEATQKRQERLMEIDQAGGKDYGEIQDESIVPGYKAVYRKGSPGLHLVKTDGTQVTVKDRVNLAAKISTIRKQMDDLDKSSQAYKDLDAIVQAAEAEMRGTPASAPKLESPPGSSSADPLGLFTK